ncbi:MAG: aminopeptidase [Elusimicrobiota bacterium]
MSRPLKALPLLALAFLGACSPVYVARSAAGHAGLLWRRRSIDKTISDPRTQPELKRKLELVVAVRAFAFDRLKLKRSHDFETWSPVEGPALTWLVEASARARLETYLFHFPLIGSFPYQGYFRRDLADREAAALERKGYDATVSGAAAYHTGLPIADPVPSTLLAYGDGALADTLIHELTHGTVYFKNRSDFDEALACWVGARGAAEYLTARDGANGAALKEYLDDGAAGETREALYRELRGRLAALYDGPGTDAEKLEKRKDVFEWARAQAKSRGLAPLREPLNNAVVLSHALYAPDFAPFDALFEKSGRDWSRTIAALKMLDRRDPFSALRRSAAGAP